MKAAYKTLIKLVLTGVLFYFALRKINLLELWQGLISVPLWLILFNLGFGLITTWTSSYRWALILLKKVTFKESLLFWKCSYLGAFYSLVFPTSLAGDALKWLPVNKKHGHLGKIKVASSVLIDRIVGASMFFPLSFLAVVVGKIIKIEFPDYLFWLFLAFFLGIIVFYLFVFFLDFEKIFGRFKFLKHFINIFDVLKKENKGIIIKGLLLSLFNQTVWLIPAWLNAHVLGANYSLIHLAIFSSVIGLILLLPISIGGWGARENFSKIFYMQVGYDPEKIILVSVFGGLIGVVSALLGGLAQLF